MVLQVPETKRLIPILEEYLEQRGVSLPEGYFSVKVICPNPKFRYEFSVSLGIEFLELFLSSYLGILLLF